jgi:hypothetical protein
MNGHELQAFRRLLFYSASEAARYLAADSERPNGVEERTWNRWEAGQRPVPENIAARVRELLAWRAARIEEGRADIDERWRRPGGAPPLRLLGYFEPDDWMGPRELMRPMQSVTAQLLAEAQPGLVALVAWDWRAFGEWARATGQRDTLASRAAWAEQVDLTLQGGATPPTR